MFSIFGTRVKVLRPKKYREGKVSSKVWDGIHVGYEDGGGYRSYIPQLGRVFVFKDVMFIEKLYTRNTTTFTIESDSDSDNAPDENLAGPWQVGYKAETDKSNAEESDNDNAQDIDDAEDADETGSDDCEDARAIATTAATSSSSTEVRKSTRKRNPVKRYGDQAHLAFLTAEAMYGNVGEEAPYSPEEAMTIASKAKWIASMVDELGSLADNEVFEVVRAPQDRKIIKCRWVFALKRDSMGKVIRYKARVVAKEYSQVQGVDYNEVFSPVVRVAENDMKLKQVDVKTAFLHGELNEELYMELPSLPDAVISQLKSNEKLNELRISMGKGKDRFVIKLRKSLYGLKQAAKQCNTKLKSALMDTNTGDRMFVLFYVDDIIIAAKNSASCERVAKALQARFTITDIDNAHFFLGVEIMRDRIARKISISQGAYIDKVLHKFRLVGTSTSVPMTSGAQFEKAFQTEADEAASLPFRELIGSLMYLATTTRPDIMYAVARLAHYFAGWSTVHWVSAKEIARYASRTKNTAFVYNGNQSDIIGFTDDDYAGDKDGRKSTGGFVFTYNGTVICWSSKRQAVVAHSSLESEYIAQARCVREALWIRKLLLDFALSISYCAAHK